jgi:hypothetical protein
MKHPYALTFLFLASSTQAQITNGSFEDANGPSLAGWEWTCDEPVSEMDAPVDGGTWSAWKQAGHAKGCFPNYLYQRIPNVNYGAPYILSGWGKCPIGDVAFCLGATIGFGTINNGSFTLAQNVTSSEPEWSYLNVEHVFDPGAGDTAIVMLSAGFIGGPINPFPAGFDQIMLSIFEGVPESNRVQVSLYPDPASDVLHVGSAVPISTVEVVDQQGRTLLNLPASSTTAHVNVSALPAGSYLVRTTTSRGLTTERFVKH